MSGLRVSNDSQSYTIHIGFSSADRELTATLANDYTETYIGNQLDLKTKATQQPSTKLSQQLVELRKQLEASEVAVQSYRRNAGILKDKESTITAQQLEDINGRLVQARNARLEAKARLSTARSLMEKGGNIEALTDVMSSEA